MGWAYNSVCLLLRYLVLNPVPGVQTSEDDANNNSSDDEVGFPSKEFVGMLLHNSNWLAIAIQIFNH